MIHSSKLTNMLLAVIAACLVVIALKPLGVLPAASAQLTAPPTVEETERFTAITAVDKAAKEQAEALRSIAAAIEDLAKSTEEVAKAIQDLGRMVGGAARGMAEGEAASPTVIETTP